MVPRLGNWTAVIESRRHRGLTERLTAWSTRRWKLIAVAGGALGAIFSALAAGQVAQPPIAVLWTAVGVTFGGGAGIGGVFMLYLVLRQHQRLRDVEEQLRALVNIRPLTGELPLDLSGWAADPVLADRVARQLVKSRPDMVVEGGSGWSTVLTACCLRELSGGRVVALEHQEEYAERTRALIRHYDATEQAEVIHAPITEVSIDGNSWRWYGVDPAAILDHPVDMLIVDGPPGDLAPKSRYPAVPILAEKLGDSWVVILDDGHRDDEAWIARRWQRRLGTEPEFDPAGGGVFLFESR